MLCLPCTFSPLPFPTENPPCDLHFSDSIPVLVVCLVFVFVVFWFAASLQFLSQPRPHSRPPHSGFSPSTTSSVWLFCLTVSLIPWLLEFHAVWFSGTSGCLLILDWLLSSFWLCEEVKGFYLRPIFAGTLFIILLKILKIYLKVEFRF